MKTASGATAVQIVWSSRRGSRNIEHIGSAHDDAELEALRAAARQRLAAGQMEFDLGLGGPGPSGPLEIASSRMGHLWDALCRAYDALGFPQATGHDETFRQLVLARIIEPASKQDSLRVLEEAGVTAPSYPTLNRRLPAWAEQPWRQRLSEACAAHARLGPASLVLYDVSTPYFETDQGDGFREPGFSKERRLEPQITIGLLTGQDLEAMIAQLDARIEAMMQPFHAARDLLVTIPGIGPLSAAAVISEIGPAPRDYFPAAGHLASWAGLCPGNHESAGKRHSGRRRHGNTYLQPVLVEIAWAAIRHPGYLKSLYHRHVMRNGGYRSKSAQSKAITTVAHAILVIIWHILATGTPYDDLGAGYFDRRTYPDREAQRLIARLQALGHRVTVEDAA